MKIVAMIPARLGSKRIPRKNIRLMNDKPLIRHVIDTALDSGEFDEIWVNSESALLGQIAEEAGVRFYERPAHLATDTATNRDYVFDFFEKHPCDYMVMVNTTSPLMRVETIRRFCSLVRTGEYDTVLSTLSEKAETFYQGKPLNFNTYEKVNSQELIPVELVVWTLTAWKRECFTAMQQRGECPVFGGRMTTFSVPKDEACDLDTEEDWRIAEGIMVSRTLDRKPEFYAGTVKRQ